MTRNTQTLRCFFLIGAACIMALGSAESALAQALNVVASGTIASSCTIAVGTAFPTANLAASGNVAATASVNCNGKFRLNATSAKGAIKTATTAPTNFTNTVPYSLTVSVPTDPSGTASATCTSAQLVAGQAGCALSPANTTGLGSGSVTTFTRTVSLTAAWTLPASRLVAGSYSDAITLSIAPVQ